MGRDLPWMLIVDLRGFMSMLGLAAMNESLLPRENIFKGMLLLLFIINIVTN